MKKILAIFMAAMLTLSMAACGSKTPTSSGTQGSTGGSSASSTKESTTPVTLKIANYAILEKGYGEFWGKVKSDFEAKHPNITIEWVTAPYGEIVNQVINMAGGGDKVDLLFGELIWIPTLVDAGLTIPANEVLSPEFLDDFYPNILDAHKVNGRVYGVPLYVSSSMLYYNKDLFKKAGLDPENPPKTYDEMLVMAEKLSKLKTADGNKVYAFGQPTASVPVAGASLTSMVSNFGGQILNTDGKLSADNQGFKQAFEMLKLLDDKGYNPQNAKPKDLRNLFALGQLAMYYDQSWGFNGINSINPKAKDFMASAMPLSGGSGKGETTLQSHCFIMMDTGDAKKDAMRKFVEFVITPEVLNNYMANVTPAYPAKKSMENMDSVVNSKILKGAAGSIKLAIATPLIPTLSEVNLELCTLAQAVTVNDKPVDKAIVNFKNAATAVLGK